MVNINAIGTTKLNTYMKKVRGFIYAPKSFYRAASEVGFQNVIRHFEKEEGLRGKWKPLSEATKAIRSQVNPKILQDSGILRMSVVPLYNSKKAEVGTNVAYGRMHQLGGKTNFMGKQRSVPARPFIWLSKDATNRIFNFFYLEMKKI